MRLLALLGSGLVASFLIVGLPLSTSAEDGCDAAYPGVCIPSPPPDLDCRDIEHRNFTVLEPDPHNFDGDGDGVGCEQR
jgi:micrococcal nuclease